MVLVLVVSAIAISASFAPSSGECAVGDTCAVGPAEFVSIEWPPELSSTLVFTDEIITIDHRGNLVVGEYNETDIVRVAETWCNITAQNRQSEQLALAVLRFTLEGFSKEFDESCPELFTRTEVHEK